MVCIQKWWISQIEDRSYWRYYYRACGACCVVYHGSSRFWWIWANPADFIKFRCSGRREHSISDDIHRFHDQFWDFRSRWCYLRFLYSSQIGNRWLFLSDLLMFLRVANFYGSFLMKKLIFSRASTICIVKGFSKKIIFLLETLVEVFLFQMIFCCLWAYVVFPF